MKEFVVLTGIIVIAYLLGFCRKCTVADCEWMDRDFTITIKGLAILTVVWAHAGEKLGVGNIQFIVGIGVTLFLICSGYGLELSYQSHGLRASG